MSSDPYHILAEELPCFVDYHIADGQFHLIKELGSGAFARVYLAVENSTGKQYAVKCMAKYEDDTPQDREQTREFELHQIAQYYCSSVVRMHEIVYEDGFVYGIMDFYEGGTLFDALYDSSFRDDPSMIKDIFLEIVDAVAQLHECGVYHRDLKPENILLSEDRRHVYIADFGLSTEDEMTTQFRVGTPCYMSPACIDSYGARSRWSTREGDIWALAVILFEMVVCNTPWDSAEDSSEAYLAFSKDPEFLGKAFPFTAELDTFFRGIFHPDLRSEYTLEMLRDEIARMDTFLTEPIESFSLNDARSVNSAASEQEIHTPLTSPVEVTVVEEIVISLSLALEQVEITSKTTDAFANVVGIV